MLICIKKFYFGKNREYIPKPSKDLAIREARGKYIQEMLLIRWMIWPKGLFFLTFFWRQLTKSSADRQDNTQKSDSKLLAFLTCNTLRKRDKSCRWDVSTIDKSCDYIKIVDILMVKLVEKHERILYQLLISNGLENWIYKKSTCN